MEITPFLDIPDVLVESGGEGLDMCFQCGTCTALCPWNLVTALNVRQIVRSAQLGFELPDGDDLWRCVTCGYCVANCPREVPIIGVIRAMRGMASASGSYPATLRAMLSSEGQVGNPWSGDPAERNAWASGLDLPVYDGRQEWLLYVCCTSCYDREARAPAQALARALLAAGASFGVAPSEAVCCGCSVREAGDGALTERLGRSNVSLFGGLGVGRVVASSPHCFNAFAKDYPQWGAAVEALHYTVLLRDLLSQGRLRPAQRVERTVTYHDPCYLGRHNGIFDEPREVLARLPGCTTVEMPRNREQSLCCGGGGGGMFMERDKSERFANLRLQEALDTGADTLATACPYCHAMFRDAIRVMQVEDRIELKDLAELVVESLETSDRGAADPVEKEK